MPILGRATFATASGRFATPATRIRVVRTRPARCGTAGEAAPCAATAGPVLSAVIALLHRPGRQDPSGPASAASCHDATICCPEVHRPKGVISGITSLGRETAGPARKCRPEGWSEYVVTAMGSAALSQGLPAMEEWLLTRRSEILRRGSRQHGDPGGHHGERHDPNRDLRRAVGEALAEQPDAQDDAGEWVDEDQQRLGYAQRPDVQGCLLEQPAGDGGGDERIHRPGREHAADTGSCERLARRLEERRLQGGGERCGGCENGGPARR